MGSKRALKGRKSRNTDNHAHDDVANSNSFMHPFVVVVAVALVAITLTVVLIVRQQRRRVEVVETFGAIVAPEDPTVIVVGNT